MFTVVGFMFLGVACGFLMRKGPTRWSGKVTTVLIWVLLLLLGIEVGSDKELIRSSSRSSAPSDWRKIHGRVHDHPTSCNPGEGP